jgi:hypothetical protein
MDTASRGAIDDVALDDDALDARLARARRSTASTLDALDAAEDEVALAARDARDAAARAARRANIRPALPHRVRVADRRRPIAMRAREPHAVDRVARANLAPSIARATRERSRDGSHRSHTDHRVAASRRAIARRARSFCDASSET